MCIPNSKSRKSPTIILIEGVLVDTYLQSGGQKNSENPLNSLKNPFKFYFDQLQQNKLMVISIILCSRSKSSFKSPKILLSSSKRANFQALSLITSHIQWKLALWLSSLCKYSGINWSSFYLPTVPNISKGWMNSSPPPSIYISQQRPQMEERKAKNINKTSW